MEEKRIKDLKDIIINLDQETINNLIKTLLLKKIDFFIMNYTTFLYNLNNKK